MLNLVHSMSKVIYDDDGIHDNVRVLNLIKSCWKENIWRARKIHAKCGAQSGRSVRPNVCEECHVLECLISGYAQSSFGEEALKWFVKML